MPFGLCNAPATFERLMEQVLVGLPVSVALVYLDDILVPGLAFPQHIANLKVVLQRLRKAKLKLSPKKCALFRKEVKYLGHVVSKEGISPDPGKTEAVKSWPKPTSVTETKSFLGLCSYYRRFVPSFADIAHPLQQCTTTVPFSWTTEADDAFEKLKLALTEAPVLAYPDCSALFILDTDASGTGIGAVLSQRFPPEDQEKVIAYFSRTLSCQERHYCVTRRELLAMVKAVKHFHVYLYGRKFQLRTDHSALRWLLNFRHPEGQVARWIESLQQYDFSIEHRSGSRHGNADALSRRPCLKDACKHCDRLESLEQARFPTEQPSLHSAKSPTAQPPTHSLSSKSTLPQVATLCLSGTDAVENRSLAQLRQAQLSDLEIKPVLEWMEKSNIRPPCEEIAPHSQPTKIYCAQWQSLKVFGGVLYRLWETPSGDAIVKQLILPKSLRPEVMQQLHGNRTSGHMGIAKTLGRIKDRFYWVQCRRDVQEWCRHCDLCAQKRGPQKKIKAPLGKYNVGFPMERIAIDVLGPLPTTDAGNKYIVIIADYFTKWVEAFATSNHEARTVAELLAKEIVCRFGVPQIIHSDQGRNFESQLFAEMCQLFGIKKTRTTPYHPQSDGMVERFNRTLETQLSKFADLNQKDWDMHIPYLLLAYRSAIHDTTSCSPARMMLGREVKLPIDLMFGRPEEEPAPTATDYANTLQDRLERVHNFARAHMQAKVDRMKQRYDLPQECQCLDPGDAAWLHNPQRKKGLSPKLQRPWQGPYIIIKRINDLVYRIQLGPHTKPKVVHRNRLWRYSGLCAPTWYKAAGEERGASPSSEAPSDRLLNIESPIGGLQALPGNLPGLRSVPDSPSTQLRRSGRSRQPPDHYGT